MKTVNIPVQKAIVTTNTPKVVNKTVIKTEPAIKKPVVDVKKPELPLKTDTTAVKELVVPVQESKAPDISKPVVEKPELDKAEQSKNPTKAEKAKVIYDEMIQDTKNDRPAIIARLKKEIGITKAGAQTYYYKFQKESGRVTEKMPSKVDKAKEVYDKMTADKKSRKDIIAAFVKEVGLTQAGSSTYYQNLKKAAAKPIKVE